MPTGAFDRNAFFVRFAAASRKARGLSRPSDEDLAWLREQGAAVPQAWSPAEVLRARLLLEACAALPASEHLALFKEVYDKGDNAERIAVLRTLPLAPDAARFVDLAAEACRSHVVDVFRAIACDNAYPGRYFSELSWNQLVMKAFFVEAPVTAIVGLEQRKNAELARMARDFAAERTAAGRPVPADLPLVMDSSAGNQVEHPR